MKKLKPTKTIFCFEGEEFELLSPDEQDKQDRFKNLEKDIKAKLLKTYSNPTSERP